MNFKEFLYKMAGVPTGRLAIEEILELDEQEPLGFKPRAASVHFVHSPNDQTVPLNDLVQHFENANVQQELEFDNELTRMERLANYSSCSIL